MRAVAELPLQLKQRLTALGFQAVDAEIAAAIQVDAEIAAAIQHDEHDEIVRPKVAEVCAFFVDAC